MVIKFPRKNWPVAGLLGSPAQRKKFYFVAGLRMSGYFGEPQKKRNSPKPIVIAGKISGGKFLS